MITLTSGLFIWFVLSMYRTYKKAGSWEKWNAIDVPLFDYFGIILGGSTLLMCILWICINFLP